MISSFCCAPWCCFCCSCMHPPAATTTGRGTSFFTTTLSTNTLQTPPHKHFLYVTCQYALSPLLAKLASTLADRQMFRVQPSIQATSSSLSCSSPAAAAAAATAVAVAAVWGGGAPIGVNRPCTFYNAQVQKFYYTIPFLSLIFLHLHYILLFLTENKEIVQIRLDPNKKKGKCICIYKYTSLFFSFIYV